MRHQIFVGFLLSALASTIAAQAAAQADDEVIANCVAIPGPIPAQRLIAYGSVSGGRLYVKKLEVKVRDVGIVARIKPGSEFGYVPDSQDTQIRTNKLENPPQLLTDKLGIEIDRRGADVREQVESYRNSTLDSFAIEANSYSKDYEVILRGHVNYDHSYTSAFRKCTLSQSALDALEASHQARGTEKTGTAKITLGVTTSAL